VTVGEPLGVLLADRGTPLDQAHDFTLQVAGAEVNVAVGLTRLGHHTAYLGAVGDDPLGRQVLRALRADDVDVSGIRVDPDRPTGLLLRDVLADRPTTISYFRTGTAATGLTPDDIDTDLVRAARLVHVTGLTAALSMSAFDACLYAATTAHDAGVAVSFDPNVRTRLASPQRWREIITAFAGLADIAFPGTADLAASVGEVEPAEWFHDHGVRTVVVKEGAAGAYESTDGSVIRMPAHPATEVDAIGAGDAFAAGWISGELRGLSPAERLREAAVVAGCVVGTRGDLPGLPTAAVRDQLLTSDMETLR
jgi:2-dehydro-3-deoxygluconokinase